MSVRDIVRAGRLTVAEYKLKDGRRIWIRALSGPGRSTYGAYVQKAKENGGIHSEVIAAMAICEEDGKLAYDWENAEDVREIVEHIDGADLEAISLKLFEVSGMTESAKDEAVKN